MKFQSLWTFLSVLDNFSDSTQLVEYSTSFRIILKKVTKLFNFSRNVHPGWMSHDSQDSPSGWAWFSNIQGGCTSRVEKWQFFMDEPGCAWMYLDVHFSMCLKYVLCWFSLYLFGFLIFIKKMIVFRYSVDLVCNNLVSEFYQKNSLHVLCWFTL